MSWYSDGDPFDEFDPPYCRGCTRGDSYEECKRCVERHEHHEDEEEDLDEE